MSGRLKGIVLSVSIIIIIIICTKLPEDCAEASKHVGVFVT
jgi:hypothetical protein